MPLINASHDSLPYIDRPPTPTSTAHAHALIRSSLSPDATNQPHPLLPPSPLDTIPHSPLIQQELQRVATSASTPLSAIDLTRYEASSSPILPPDTSLQSAKASLQTAYTNSTYLSLRLQALELLEKYGKNAWLMANWETEGILGALERELEGVKGEVMGVNRERKGAQEGGRGALEGLESEWRGGVGRLVEAELGVREVEGALREKLRGS